ncbi:lactoylglutathione lyase family protein [soil metagenome]
MSAPTTAFSHVGVTVPDLEKAMEWYQSVLGYYLVAGPVEVREDDTEMGPAAAGIYGDGFRSFRFAHLIGPDAAGLELFSFTVPEMEIPENTFEFWKTGINHFALTAPDMDATVAAIEAGGGRRRSAPVMINPDLGYSVLYCEDPWGTIIELCSHPYPQMWS